MTTHFLSMLLKITSLFILGLVLYGTSISATSEGISAPEDTVTFMLFTRKNPTEAQVLEVGNFDQLLQSNYDSSVPTKIYAHGWVSSPSAHGWDMRDGYFQHEDCNFIAVDWSVLAQGDYSVVASENVPVVGRITGSFVDFLVEQGAPLASFHLIGFSMGAHVVGIAGYSVTSGKLPRITGLDPAGRDFLTFDLPLRLDRSDAEFVDVIHTSAGHTDDPIGHVDFFPNGGLVQPGCPDPDAGCCNHCRALSLFSESITSQTGFWSVECSLWEDFLAGSCDENNAVLMGNPVSLTERGVYYLATNGEPPYAIPPLGTCLLDQQFCTRD